MLSKQVAQQSCVCPDKHILNTHTIWDVSAEALSDVSGQKVSVGVPLTIRHQEQHPHKSHVDCMINKYLTCQIVLHYIMCCYVLSRFSYQESPLLGQRLSALWSCCSSSSRCQWEVAADRNCRYCLFLLHALRHDHLMRVMLVWFVLFFQTEAKIENCEKKVPVFLRLSSIWGSPYSSWSTFFRTRAKKAAKPRTCDGRFSHFSTRELHNDACAVTLWRTSVTVIDSFAKCV